MEIENYVKFGSKNDAVQIFPPFVCKIQNLFVSLRQKRKVMPTLLRLFGLRFFFYLDEHRPIHVHVEHSGKFAKIELEPEIKTIYNHGLKENEMRMAVETCMIYREKFIEEWYNRFGNQ